MFWSDKHAIKDFNSINMCVSCLVKVHSCKHWMSWFKHDFHICCTDVIHTPTKIHKVIKKCRRFSSTKNQRATRPAWTEEKAKEFNIPYSAYNWDLVSVSLMLYCAEAECNIHKRMWIVIHFTILFMIFLLTNQHHHETIPSKR